MSILKTILFLGLFVSANFAGDLPDLKLKDSHSPLYPKSRPFGTAAQWGDSSNYFIFNQGVKMWGSLYTLDSLIVTQDAYIRQNLYLDTSGQINIVASGYGMVFYNLKNYGSISHYIGNLDCNFSWWKAEGVVSVQLMQLDTIKGLEVMQGNIQLTGGTQQIKIPKDTVSDYDGNDSVTINKQNGRVTTQSLTTAGDADYTITVVNSLVSTTSNILAVIMTNGGAGAPIVRQTIALSGSFQVIIRNIDASALNNTVGFTFLVIN